MAAVGIELSYARAGSQMVTTSTSREPSSLAASRTAWRAVSEPS